jgi:hypothetical protein
MNNHVSKDDSCTLHYDLDQGPVLGQTEEQFLIMVLKLVLCVYFVDRCLSFCLFSFSHCVVCSSSIYGF